MEPGKVALSIQGKPIVVLAAEADYLQHYEKALSVPQKRLHAHRQMYMLANAMFSETGLAGQIACSEVASTSHRAREMLVPGWDC